VKTQKINWVDLSESEKIEVLKQARTHLQEQVEHAKFCRFSQNSTLSDNWML
jgi:predicted Fe-S protein YdhL (DUF1289 family)